MIKDVGCEWVILGHSERRHVFGESDQVSACVFEFHQTQATVRVRAARAERKQCELCAAE